MKKIIIVLTLFSTLAFGEDIRLKNGISVINVKIVGQNEKGFLEYQTSDARTLSVHVDAISEIIHTPFDINKATEGNGNISELIETNQEYNSMHFAKYEYPNLKLLPISVIAFALSFDYFIDASDLSESIDNIINSAKNDSRNLTDNENKLIDELESTNSRKTVLGVTFLVAGIINTYFAFESVEIKSTPNSIGLSLRF